MAGEKRSQEQEETSLSHTTILLDIEGTTTSISFVKEILFPYVRNNLKKYIDSKWEDEEFKQDYAKLKEQAKKDEENKVEGFVSMTGTNTDEEKELLIKNILWQMDCDRKTAALKQLQGHMWREAYNSEAVKAHVYEDVPKALKSWTNDGKKVYIYSSGSVEAQKLLFGHSEYGDLLEYFSGYFDTQMGSKLEANSYRNILTRIGEKANNVIFLTDIVKEAAAAKEAGLSTAIVIREGNAALTEEDKVAFTTIKSFSELTFQTSTKRQKLDLAMPEKKVEAPIQNISEPMDTSEDVEVSDGDSKKVEKMELNEIVESKQNNVEISTDKKDHSSVKTEENIIPDAKSVTENINKADVILDEKPISVTKESDSNEESNDVSENTERKEVVPLDKAFTTLSETKKSSDVEEKVEQETKIETSVVDDSMDIVANESVSKSEEISLEKKMEGKTPTVKDTKIEAASQVETVDNNKVKDTCVSNSESETCKRTEEDQVKAEETISKSTASSTTVSKGTNSDETNTVEKKVSAEVASMPSANTKKTDNDVITESAEKVDAETTNSKKNVKDEDKQSAEAAVEVNSEVEAVSNKDEKDAKDVCREKEALKNMESTSETEKYKSTEQQELKKELATEATTIMETAAVVDEVKDSNKMESEEKKLNGTTQNGDNATVSEEKQLHSNGLTEASSSEQLASNKEGASSQNGEPENSSEASAESIKVKKVVDSAVADGAGEPDVVPPVVVAATS